MSDDYTFDWVALAPIAPVAARVEQVCGAHGVAGTWYSSTRAGVPVKGCRLIGEGGATLAALTLQGYRPDQTHLRLQPAARAADLAQVAALAGALYAALRAARWLPAGAASLDHTPRFVRPPGFEPRPGVPGEPG